MESSPYSSFHYILLHELSEFLCATTWHKAQPQSACINLSPGLLAVGNRSPGAYLNGSNDRRLVVDATPFAFCTATYKRFIHFDTSAIANAQGIGHTLGHQEKPAEIQGALLESREDPLRQISTNSPNWQSTG